MSALLDEIINREHNSEIELCILWVLADAEDWSEDHPPYEHAKNAAAELAQLRAENERLTARLQAAEGESDKLRRNFAKYLAKFYVAEPSKIAHKCDVEIDRTGALLGYVREAAAALQAEGAK